MKLTLHARIEIGIAAVLLLGSCAKLDGNLSDAQKDEVGDIAGDVAYDTVTEHEKVREFEGRIAEIESRLNM